MMCSYTFELIIIGFQKVIILAREKVNHVISKSGSRSANIN